MGTFIKVSYSENIKKHIQKKHSNVTSDDLVNGISDAPSQVYENLNISILDKICEVLE